MKKAILIVDDEPNNVKLLTDVFTVMGYKTLSAVNGKEAVALATSQKPDIILMDVHLPELDGLAATGLLKKHPETCHIPVLAVSGFAMPEDEKMATEAGCDGYITKPFDLLQLRNKIEEYLFP